MELAPKKLGESSILDFFQMKSTLVSSESESNSDPESLPASRSEVRALNHHDSSGKRYRSMLPHQTSPGATSSTYICTWS